MNTGHIILTTIFLFVSLMAFVLLAELTNCDPSYKESKSIVSRGFCIIGIEEN